MAAVDFEKFLGDISKRTGASVESSDLAELRRKNPEDVQSHMRALEQQYEKRGAPTAHRSSDSQSSGWQSNTSNNQQGRDPRQEQGYRGPAAPAPAPQGPRPVAPPSQNFSAPTADLSSIEAYIRQLYRQFLGRDPSDDEVRGHREGLPNSVLGTNFQSQGRQRLLDSFMSAEEYQQAQPAHVQAMYRELLGRDPSNEEIQAHAGNTAGIEGVRYALGTSAEYQQKQAAQKAEYERQVRDWESRGRPGPPPQPPPPPPSPPPPPTNTARRGWDFGPTNVPSQFSDPIASWLERFANTRAQQLESPPPGSGQNLLEDALRRISGDFQQGGFTSGEQEIFTTQAMDPLERLRTSRKQQVTHELSRRGIAPTSGVAVQMLQDVDRQFDAMRSQTQAGLAGQFAQERVARLLQSLGLLGNLAGTENQRLDQAFQYRTVPLNLADRAFGQAMQVFNAGEMSANNAYNRLAGTYNMGGNPLSLVNPLMNLANQQQGRMDNSQEMLGYLAYILAQGGRR